MKWRSGVRALQCSGAAALATTLAVVLASAPSALACGSITVNGCDQSSGYPTGCTGNWFIGGHLTTSSAPWAVAATVTSANPAPVWSQSSAWTMLENTNAGACSFGDCLVQIGWIHWYSCSQPGHPVPGGGGSCSNDGNEHVFTEWISNSGTFSPEYYYNVPSGGTERFSVIKSSSGYFYLDWNEGQTQTPSSGTYAATWGTSGIEYDEEVNDYDGRSNTGLPHGGSQYGGTSASKVQFTNLIWEDKNANVYTPSIPPADQYYDAYAGLEVPYGGNITSWFYAWDGRC